MPEWTFANELRLSPINVPRAALRFARAIAYPQLDVTYYMRQLHNMAHMAQESIMGQTTVAQKAAALTTFFIGTLEFRGNLDNYYDPDNSFLNCVLDSRQGIPISLAVIFVDLAQRLGLPAFGVGLPGHFVVMVRDAAEPLYLDLFHGGGLLSEADCQRLIAETAGYTGPLQPAWLRPSPPKAILMRMLNNLRQVTIQQQDWATAVRVVDHLRLMQPEAPLLHRDLGLLQLKLGNTYQAARHLEQYLTLQPDADDAAVLKTAVGPQLTLWSRSN